MLIGSREAKYNIKINNFVQQTVNEIDILIGVEKIDCAGWSRNSPSSSFSLLSLLLVSKEAKE
jgi:hypothetical protein